MSARYWMFRKALEDLFPIPKNSSTFLHESWVDTLRPYVILELTKSGRIVLCNLVQNLFRVMSPGSKALHPMNPSAKQSFLQKS